MLNIPLPKIMLTALLKRTCEVLRKVNTKEALEIFTSLSALILYLEMCIAEDKELAVVKEEVKKEPHKEIFRHGIILVGEYKADFTLIGKHASDPNSFNVRTAFGDMWIRGSNIIWEKGWPK